MKGFLSRYIINRPNHENQVITTMLFIAFSFLFQTQGSSQNNLPQNTAQEYEILGHMSGLDWYGP